MRHQKVPLTAGRRRQSRLGVKTVSSLGQHCAYQQAGQQIAAVHVQCGVTQARIAAAIRMRFERRQNYDNALNRASRLLKIAQSRELPVGRLFKVVGAKGGDCEIPSFRAADERIAEPVYQTEGR